MNKIHNLDQRLRDEMILVAARAQYVSMADDNRAAGIVFDSMAKELRQRHIDAMMRAFAAIAEFSTPELEDNDLPDDALSAVCCVALLNGALQRGIESRHVTADRFPGMILLRGDLFHPSAQAWSSYARDMKSEMVEEIGVSEAARRLAAGILEDYRADKPKYEASQHRGRD